LIKRRLWKAAAGGLEPFDQHPIQPTSAGQFPRFGCRSKGFLFGGRCMEFHPVANIFPMMSAEEFEALKADILANGLREDIWLHNNQTIDGRNR
jgi:hypothetical protein